MRCTLKLCKQDLRMTLSRVLFEDTQRLCVKNGRKAKFDRLKIDMILVLKVNGRSEREGTGRWSGDVLALNIPTRKVNDAEHHPTLSLN